CAQAVQTSPIVWLPPPGANLSATTTNAATRTAMSACGRNIRGPRTRPTPSAASTGYAPAGRGMDTAAAPALPRARLDHGYGLLYGDVARAGLRHRAVIVQR